MPWTNLHWTVFALLCLLALAALVIVHLLDTRGAPSRKQLRAWRRDRLEQPTWNRPRK